MNWKAYKKLIAVVVGLGMLFAVREYDLYLPGMSELVMEMIVSMLTAFGVYQANNEQ